MHRRARAGQILVFTAAVVAVLAAAAGAGQASDGVPVTPPRDPEKTRAEITELLQHFLAPGVNPTRAAHERFWAEDLVYTSSAGKVTNKAEILKSFDAAPEPEAAKASEPEPVYSAEDVAVRSYGLAGEVAALTFRLVARAADGTVQQYRNSGTFVLRDGKWQAVTWQATKVPPLPLPPLPPVIAK